MFPSVSFQLFLRSRVQEDMFGMLNNAGFRRCELWVMKPHIDYNDGNQSRKIREWSEKHNVSTNTAHLPIYTSDFRVSLGDREYGRRSLDEMLYATDFLNRTDVKILILHATGIPEIFYENFIKLYDNTDRKFAVENNPNDFPLLDDVIAIVSHLRRELPDGENRIGICLDVGHANVQGRDLQDSIRQLGKLLIATHISDNRGIYDEHLIPGEGNIDWQKVIDSLKGIEYSHNFTFEIAPVDELNEAPKLLEKLISFCNQNNLS